MFMRTLTLPIWGRVFVPCVLAHTLILLGVELAIAVLANDCLTWLFMGLASLSLVFMCYFALEAVRTENFWQ